MLKNRQKDIAEALNISITTVSRALNNKPDVSKKTRDSVLKVAEMMNYSPNVLAVSLRKKTTNIIGVVLPKIDHYFFSTILKGILDKASEMNKMVLIGESNNSFEQEKEILNQFLGLRVSGILIASANHQRYRENIDYLVDKKVPHTLMDRPYHAHSGHQVYNDDYQGAYHAIKHLHDQGYQKIAIIKGPDHCGVSENRFNGYKDALSDAGIPINDGHVISSSLTNENDSYYLAKSLLTSSNPPNAFFTINDDMAIGVYEAANELNLSIPDDIGVVGFSNSRISQFLNPKLTTVEQDGHSMGEHAFTLLKDMIEINAKPVKKKFDSNLIIRESSLKPN